ncbi:MAG TPA: phosphotransferase family protein [Conexibacter sp.]|nr:phosphotransferase family protein [Conexibacter sp.]
MNDDRPVRDEDAFDVAAVDSWLREASVDGLGAGAGLPEVRQFAGGASNLTYLLRYPARELILRRPPAGTKASSAHDVAREHRIQAALRPAFPYVPEMVALCTEHAVLGGDFYVMERVEGVIPRATMPAEVGTDPARMQTLGERFVDLLAELHAVDPAAAGLAELGRGPGYVGRQVAGWSERYRRAKTWNVPSFERTMRWLEAEQPDDVGACVIHNDFRLDNLVLDREDPLRVRAVLDWELATIGDPLMDLGSSLAYWVQADDGLAGRLFRRQPSHLPGMPSRAEIVARYGERTGLPIEGWAFYEVFGLFRLAVIAQQIYYRYHHRETRNPAFRRFWVAAHLLERRCRRLIRPRRTSPRTTASASRMR